MIADVTGIGSALALASTLAGGLIWYLQRRAAKKDDPKNVSEQQKDENREAIAKGTAGELLNRRLNRLPDRKD